MKTAETVLLSWQRYEGRTMVIAIVRRGARRSSNKHRTEEMKVTELKTAKLAHVMVPDVKGTAHASTHAHCPSLSLYTHQLRFPLFAPLHP